MKPLHLPLEGHDLLAVERFKDDTRHMAEFLILSTHLPLDAGASISGCF